VEEEEGEYTSGAVGSLLVVGCSDGSMLVWDVEVMNQLVLQQQRWHDEEWQREQQQREEEQQQLLNPKQSKQKQSKQADSKGGYFRYGAGLLLKAGGAVGGAILQALRGANTVCSRCCVCSSYLCVVVPYHMRRKA
jgi:hypothetical protein